MDKLVLTTDEIEKIFQWKDENKDYVRDMISPVKAIEIVCSDIGRLKCIRENDSVKVSLFNNYSKIADAKVDILPNIRKFNVVSYKSKHIKLDDFAQLISLYFIVMALMTYGNEDKEYEYTYNSTVETATANPKKKTGGNKKNKVYILKNNKGTINLGVKGSHASPKGIFNVRGHWRHYKNGKKVCIAEYEKGSKNKKKSKTYAVGKL